MSLRSPLSEGGKDEIEILRGGITGITGGRGSGEEIVGGVGELGIEIEIAG